MTSKPPQLLPRMLAADEVVHTMQRIISDQEAVRNLVASKVTPETATFANFIRP